MRFVPHEYQQRAISFILDHPAAGLFLDMGLGKTVVTLTAVRELVYERFEVSRVLVIAPLRVAWDTWTREADKWDHLQDLRVSRILGTAPKREAALSEEADVYVVNRENVEWLVRFYKGRKEPWPFDMVVIDELSSFKSSQSKRFKALKKVRPYIDRIIGLTGTPAGNGLMDLWAEMYLLDRGERLGQSLRSYQYLYFNPGWSNAGIVYKWNPVPNALQAITARISDITMSMTASDYLQLPERIESTIEVHMSPSQTKVYNDMERKSLIELDGEEITAMTAAAAMNKLLQLANGFAYGEDRKVAAFHELKIDALSEIVEQADGSVLVFYSFLADRDLILRHLSMARQLDGEDDIRDWNEGRIQVLVAHPASVGYGLNLQDGGHVIVWYGLPWSLEQYQQANARLHRQGQTRPVLIYRILTAGTVDTAVAGKLEQKDMTQNALLDVLKERKHRC